MALSYLPDLESSIFSDLADGFGDQMALGELDTAQYSLNAARLELLRRLAIERFPELCADADLSGALALLAKAESVDGESVRTVFEVPTVGAWISRCLIESLASVDRQKIRRDLRYAWAVAAAASIHANLDFECPVPIHGDRIFLPGIGAYPAADTDGPTVVLRQGGGHLSLDDTPIDPVGGPGWLTNRELVAAHNGLRIQVVVDDLDPYRSSGSLTPAPRLADDMVVALQNHLSDAWSILVERHRTYAAGISAALRSLVLLDGYPANRGVSAALRDSHGSVCLTMPVDATSFAVTLVHEAQHLKLNRVLERVDLHHCGPDRRFRAPWREDPRPLEGLIHGAYAFTAVADFWRTERAVTSGSAWAVAEFEFTRWRAEVSEALTTIARSGELTKAGAYFFSRLARRVAPWLDEKVDDEVRAMVDQAILDDEVSWRLRNSHVDAGVAEGLACQYLAGDEATEVPLAFAVKPGAAGRASHFRQGLVRLSLIDVERFDRLTSDPASLAAEAPGVSSADVAYVLRDVNAENLYRELVEGNPADLEAWTGLALSLHRRGQTALVGHVELTRAVHGHLCALGKSVDPEDLARWLSAAYP